jgi:hypothetical protein
MGQPLIALFLPAKAHVSSRGQTLTKRNLPSAAALSQLQTT